MDSSDIHMTETDLMKFLTLLPKMKLERSEKPIETVLATDSSLYYVSLSLSLSRVRALKYMEYMGIKIKLAINR